MRHEEIRLTSRHAVVAMDHLRVECLSQRDLARVGAGEVRISTGPFPKLEITSRAQLRDALAERTEVSDRASATALR